MAVPWLVQFCLIKNHNLDLTDSRKIGFVIGIGYRLNQGNQTIMIIDICNTIGYNCDTCTITIRIHGYGIHDVMTSVITILIKIAILVSALVVLTAIFGEINSILDEISESESGYGMNSNVSKKNQITRVAMLILRKLFIIMVVIFFIMQAMDASSLHVVPSFEFDSTSQLVLNLFIQSSVGAAYCNTEMIRNVCVVFNNVVLFLLICFFHFFLNLKMWYY